jgi:hypothetical protein
MEWNALKSFMDEHNNLEGTGGNINKALNIMVISNQANIFHGKKSSDWDYPEDLRIKRFHCSGNKENQVLAAIHSHTLAINITLKYYQEFYLSLHCKGTYVGVRVSKGMNYTSRDTFANGVRVILCVYV